MFGAHAVRQPWSLTAATLMLGSVVILSGCADVADRKLNGQVEAMEQPWGPFSRQCASTEVSHAESRSRVRQTEIPALYQGCVGYSALEFGADAQITASVQTQDQSPVVVRILRHATGNARAASHSDSGLLAQGSDSPDVAAKLARSIGLTARQVITPDETLVLPVQLSVPYPLDAALNCHADGSREDRGRETLVLSCALDQPITTDHIDARLQLEGSEEIDLKSGIRLTSTLTGRLKGRMRTADGASWQRTHDTIRYQMQTEVD